VDALRFRQVGTRGYAGGERVAGILEHELDGTALDGSFGAPGAVGIHVAAVVAGVGGVCVDDDADGSQLLGDVDLDAAEIAAVAADDDVAFDVDVELFEFLKIFGSAVVGVDGGSGDVAGGG
jgi:hypothetical protein